jgi:hypothetical protein
MVRASTDPVEEDPVTSVEANSGKPEFYKVRLSHPDNHRKTVFRSVSQKRARAFVERRYPRGSEAYLEHPDGTTEHHEAERQGEYGMDADAWAPFDPDTYQPVEHGTPPGDSEWADLEG